MKVKQCSVRETRVQTKVRASVLTKLDRPHTQKHFKEALLRLTCLESTSNSFIGAGLTLFGSKTLLYSKTNLK